MDSYNLTLPYCWQFEQTCTSWTLLPSRIPIGTSRNAANRKHDAQQKVCEQSTHR